jgi:hypothetical protein
VSPGFILPFCRYRPVEADAGLPAWSSLPTELEFKQHRDKNANKKDKIVLSFESKELFLK